MNSVKHACTQAGFRQACSIPFPLDHIYLPPQGLSQRLLSPPQGLSQRLLFRNHVFITIYSNLYYFIAFYRWMVKLLQQNNSRRTQKP